MRAEAMAAWIPCSELGCENGLTVDARHVRNFDGRDWTCRDCEETR